LQDKFKILKKVPENSIYIFRYHIAISNEIQRLRDIFLDGNTTESNAIIELLIFINNYMGEHFMGNPELGLNKDKLPELLDTEQQNLLLKQYYDVTKACYLFMF
jgi:hypothetical protein